jgi:hypothetical protein
MDRYHKRDISIVVIVISIAFNLAVLQANNLNNGKQIITQEQAAEHAAKLANEKCQKDFGSSPFTSGSYKAELVDSRWHWGKIDPKGFNGYSAEVEFNKDGTDEDVKVAFHTDELRRILRNNETQQKTIIIEERLHILDIDDRKEE